jgi:hypothetical protein
LFSMYLTSSNLVHYLAARGTITRTSVVDGDFEVRELDGRNRCFKVMRRNHPSLFVKQIKEIDDLNVHCLEREAACYRLGASDPRFTALAHLIPRYIDYDSARFALVVEMLPDSEDLRECHRRLGSFPVELGAALGRGLGGLHSAIDSDLAASLDAELLSKVTPWILSVHTSTDRETGTDGILTKLVRQDHAWQESLDKIRGEWNCNTLIHGDLKWDNCVVFPDGSGQPQVRLIDWEMAGFGDSAWDVGGLFQAYWSIAILAALRKKQPTEVNEAELIESSIDAVRPALQEFWRAYVRAREWTGGSERAFLARCVRCGAARLMQTTFEYAAAVGNVNDRATALFRVSRDILRDPDRARAWLLGSNTRASS